MTKATGYDAVGYDAVREAARRAAAANRPVVAIGGITLETARASSKPGRVGCVITDLLTDDPEARLRLVLIRASVSCLI
jgi:thiamine monophosphate synthase